VELFNHKLTVRQQIWEKMPVAHLAIHPGKLSRKKNFPSFPPPDGALIKRMKKFLLPAILLALGIAHLTAQDSSPTPTPTPGTNGILSLWRCTTPGGTYEVALRSIVSVSSCEYLVDGAARVHEVNIDTSGNMAVRFYFLEPVTTNSPIGLGQATINKVQEIATEASERVSGDEVWKKVVKNYPTTTHAHTIEYRVDTQGALDAIFTSAEKAFRTGRGEQYTVK
jgi:hypothetical protein